MKPLDTKNRRRPTWSPAPERLETRQVLSAGAGNTIAIMPTAITEADKPVTVEFSVDPASFKSPRGKLLLGIDVVAPTNSTAKPLVGTLVTSTGAKVTHKTHATRTPVVIGGQPVTAATVAEITLRGRRTGATPQAATKYKLTVRGENKTTGQFLTGFYLVGDANGDGKVQRKDLKEIRTALNSKADQTAYNFDADANRDGRVNRTDLMLAQRNLGARTSILPLISADLDPATADAATRTTTQPQASVQGVASAGATVAYVALGGAMAPVSTTADATGNYKISVPLAKGANTFMVTSTDSFGQTITGSIAAITYKPAGSS